MRKVALLTLSLLAAACSGPTGPDMNVAGEPCATLASAPANRSARQETSAGGATLRRQGGLATCEGGVDGAGQANATARCDLSGAGFIHVTTADGRDHYFDVPTVQASTILIEDNAVRCVLTGPR